MPSLRALFVLLLAAASFSLAGDPLPGTQPLTAEGDLSVQMVDGIHRWLARARKTVDGVRAKVWLEDFAIAADKQAWAAVAKKRRAELAEMIGAVDERRSGELVVQLNPAKEMSAIRGESPMGSYAVRKVIWSVFDGVHGEGVIMQQSKAAKAAIIVLPDANQTPEQSAGIQAGNERLQFARVLAERGFLVIVPVLVDRRDDWSGSEKLKRFTNAPHREWIHRQSFEAGRTLIGYEVQKVLAAVDALRGLSATLLAKDAKIGVAGNGEGGLVALCAAALDTRIEAAFVDGYFGAGESDDVIYRNIFGKRLRFSDAGLAALIFPRRLEISSKSHIDTPPIPESPAVKNGRRGAAPGAVAVLDSELAASMGRRSEQQRAILDEYDDFRSWFAGRKIQRAKETTQPVGRFFEMAFNTPFAEIPVPSPAKWSADEEAVDERQRRTIRELEDFSQAILRDSERVRKALPIWTKLKPGAGWEAVQKQARADFWENVIGKLPGEYLKPNPRTRLIHDKEKWRGYEVMLDVQPDIFAWGTLLVPKDLKPGERRPVVVCQHGLEGLPEDTITQDESAPAWKYYKGFAARLCERGFIVYAPHNPYRGGDNFRRIQREANPLGLSLFSFIIAQHDVTTQWLASLPFVDAERIAFYGLSYGGKTAMRVPAVLERYCLSICSGDFNEWVMKCASNTHPNGYIFTGEWEIWEWDLAHTFNYAEMALLIAPRPFMVERGHDDGVGLDEDVGHEFAKVRRGYDKLGIGERTEIEWFDGPHTIHGVGTFKFLHKWLRWPEPK